MPTPKNLTKRQLAAVELLRGRLDPKSPLFAASDCVRDALTGEAKLYFTTYVLPVLDFLLDGEQWHGQAESIQSDLAGRRQAVRRAAQVKLERERLAGATDAELKQFREDRSASPAGDAVREHLGL